MMQNTANELSQTNSGSTSRAYLEPAEVVRLEEAATNLRDRLMIRMLFHLGCRISEALAIEVKDIDFETGSLTILHLKSRIKLSCPQCGSSLGLKHVFCPHCGRQSEELISQAKEQRRQRKLPVDQESLQMLQDYVKAGGPVGKKGKTLLFGINRHRAWQIISACATRAGLPKLINQETGKIHNVSPHKLRDAFAVHAVKLNDSGDTLRMLQEHLGHQNFNTTARYRKVSGQELRHWYDQLWSESK